MCLSGGRKLPPEVPTAVLWVHQGTRTNRDPSAQGDEREGKGQRKKAERREEKDRGERNRGGSHMGTRLPWVSRVSS